MTQLIRFPSLEQFRNAVKRVRDRARWVGRDETGEPIFDPTKPVPTLKFTGTVKFDGTNSAIIWRGNNEDGSKPSISFQSRERVLTLEQDNAGFMATFIDRAEDLQRLFFEIVDTRPMDKFPNGADVKTIAVFGEWCGGNIQKGVAITGLPKMFVIFAVRLTFNDGTAEWLDIAGLELENREAGIFNVFQFGRWEVEIDFNQPEIAQQKIVELTEAIEAECPAGKFFGASGIGEGLVFTCREEGWTGSDIWFKSKGSQHSVSKVKTLASIDIEAFKKQQDFIDSVVTEARLIQGLQNLVREQLKPFDMKSMGDFLRWVVNDIKKEENDTLTSNGFDPKKVGGPISNKARPWFIQKLNEGFEP
jgi:hypothetical protein